MWQLFPAFTVKSSFMNEDSCEPLLDAFVRFCICTLLTFWNPPWSFSLWLWASWEYMKWRIVRKWSIKAWRRRIGVWSVMNTWQWHYHHIDTLLLSCWFSFLSNLISVKKRYIFLHCADGLKCFQRHSFTPAPRCAGIGMKYFDCRTNIPFLNDNGTEAHEDFHGPLQFF